MPDEKEKTTSPKDVTKESKKDEDQVDDFKYIVRIANSDMPGDKGVVFALTAIKGIGDRVAEVIINKTKLPRNEKIGNLSDEDIEKLEAFVLELSDQTPGWLMNKQNDVWTGEDVHILGSEMDMRNQEDNFNKQFFWNRSIRL